MLCCSSTALHTWWRGKVGRGIKTQPPDLSFGKPWRRGCCSRGSSRPAVCLAAMAGGSCSASAAARGSAVLFHRPVIGRSAAVPTAKSRRIPGSRFVPFSPFLKINSRAIAPSSTSVLHSTFPEEIRSDNFIWTHFYIDTFSVPFRNPLFLLKCLLTLGACDIRAGP